METFDEDNDGIITFEDFGKMGSHGILLHLAGDYISRMAKEKLGYLKGRFALYSKILGKSDWFSYSRRGRATLFFYIRDQFCPAT